MLEVLNKRKSYALTAKGAKEIDLTDETVESTVEDEWFSAEISRKTLKSLMKRSDAEGWKNFGLWLVLLVGSGYLAFLSWGTWWAVPAFLVYGTIYSSSDARWHECGHGTPFRTRWINEIFYHLCSFMTMREGFQWRWSHARHHTHTIIVGDDPEIQVSRPADLVRIALDFFNLTGGLITLKTVFTHAFGRITPDAAVYVPKGEQKKMIRSAQVYVAVMTGAVVWAVVAGSFLPIMFIVTPRFYGGWLHQLCALTQHAGLAEDVKDHRLNSRSVYMNPVYRFLYLNMNYHIEHHMFPMVPFFNLPKLHEEIKDQLPHTYTGIIDVYREIIPALWHQAFDEGYYIVRELPERARRRDDADALATARA